MTDVDLAAIPAAVEEASAGRERRRWVARAASYVLTVWFLLTLNFCLPRALPGGPVEAMLATSGTTTTLDDEERAALERYYGFDEPLLTQYGRYLAGIPRGDLGLSIRYNRPVADVILDHLPWTLLLGTTALAIATIGGLAAGIHAGWRRGRAVDRTLVGTFIGLHAVPPFFLAPLAIAFFSVELGWFPLGGASDPFLDASLFPRVVDIAHHLVLPALTTAVLFASFQFLIMRAGMVSELASDYLLLGRAKGLSERRLKYRYVARNALLPVVSTTGLELGAAVSSGVLVEAAFAYPGIGRLLFEAVPGRDYPMIQGCFLLVTMAVVTANFLADLIYARVDPRVTA